MNENLIIPHHAVKYGPSKLCSNALHKGWPDKIYFGQNIFRCKFTKYIQVLHQNDVKISLKYNLTRPLKGHQSFLHSNPLIPLPDCIFWFGYYIKSQSIIKLIIFWRLTGPHHNPQASFGQDLSPFEKLTSFLDRTAPKNTNIISEYILSDYILSCHRNLHIWR